MPAWPASVKKQYAVWCCIVLQCVVACCNLLQCLLVYCSIMIDGLLARQRRSTIPWDAMCCSKVQCVAVSCSVYWCPFCQAAQRNNMGVVISCSVLNFFAMCSSMLQCVACSSMLQCVALCGSVIVHARLVRQHKWTIRGVGVYC